MVANENFWPEGKKCAVIFSYDVDAETLWLFVDRKNADHPVELSMGSYGINEGMPRILRVLEKYGIKATFFVPGWVIEKYMDVFKDVNRRGHEIAHHGYLHEAPETLSLEEEKNILQRGIDIITSVSGQRPLGWRSPGGEFSPNTLKLLRDHGFLYDSILMDRDMPHLLTIEGEKSRLVELPFEWPLSDTPHFLYSIRLPPRVMKCPSDVYEIYSSEFDALYKEGKYFHLAGHPQLIGRASRMAMIERLIQHIKAKRGVWIATCKDVAEHSLKKLS